MGDESNAPEINVTPPEAEAAPGFPLTHEFLELAFDRKVKSFATNLGTNPGDNYLSIIHTADVIFEGETEPQHYLVKCYPNHPGRREFLDQMEIFEKELLVYSDFLPKLKKITKERGDGKVQLSTAPFHGGNVASSPSEKFKGGPWAKENFIIMTDLRKAFGYSMQDRMKGLDIVHAKFVLTEIAKLHAVTWAYKKINGLQFLTTHFPSFYDSMYHGENAEAFLAQFKGLMDQISDLCLSGVKGGLGENHPAYLAFHELMKTKDPEDMMKQFTVANGIDEDLIEGMLRVKPPADEDHVKEPWLVGTHGDCWINNMMFQHLEGPQTPSRLTFVDFQIFREACPTLDLEYFLFCSVRSHLLFPRKDELLQTYYDAFLEFCYILQVEPLPGFTLDNLKRRFRRGQVFGLLISLPLLCFVLKPPEEAKDIDAVEGTDMSDVFSAVLEGSDKNALFNNEISAIVSHMYDEGII